MSSGLFGVVVAKYLEAGSSWRKNAGLMRETLISVRGFPYPDVRSVMKISRDERFIGV